MDRYPALNLPPVRLRAAHRHGEERVWDGLRGCWLLLTPEEWVRRHVIGWLSDCIGIPAVNIIQEYQLSLGGTRQRADIVVTGRGQQAVMLVECKAADVAIDQCVLDQAVRYNSVVRARYIMLTNGLRHYFFATGDGTDYERLGTVPDLAAWL